MGRRQTENYQTEATYPTKRHCSGPTTWKFKACTIGCLLGLASTSLASAADLPPPTVPPVYIPPPAFSWAGPYLGVTAGFANGFHSYDDLAGAFLGYPGLANNQNTGFAGGGTIGYNLQAGNLVYGLEADLSWLSNRSSYVDPNGAINNFYPSETNRLSDLGTVRGRLGLAVDRSLFYFTAGLAFGEVTNSVQYNSSKFPTFNTPSYNLDSTRFGWVVGSGLEYAMTPNWTVKGEAIYAQLNTVTASWVSPGSPAFPANAVYNTRFNTSVAVVRAGLNYKFNWFGSSL
jgi:outer membrane immunogenic protein